MKYKVFGNKTIVLEPDNDLDVLHIGKLSMLVPAHVLEIKSATGEETRVAYIKLEADILVKHILENSNKLK